MNDEQTETINLKIEKMVYGGQGLARHEGKTIFVSNVAPGELVKAKIKYKKKGVLWAKSIEILENNDQARISPLCQHSDECGGCTYQHLNYESQVKIKEQILAEIYQDLVPLGKTIQSPKQLNYRNKCEFTFGEAADGQIQLGLHPEGKFFEVLDLKECHLLAPEMWQVLVKAKELVQKSGLKVFKDLQDSGFWSTITLRHSSSSEHVLVIWKVKDPLNQQLCEMSEALQKEFSFIKGILARPAPRGELHKICGLDTIAQAIDSVELVYQAENFFQINTHVLPLLMDRLLELVKLSEADLVYDLFGGVGAIGIYVASKLPHLQKVIGAEADKLACEMASFNAELNQVANYQSNYLNLYKGKWGGFLKDTKYKSCVIVDPPRAGLTSKAIREVLEMRPQSLIYVSCNPTTQKRDIDEFKEAGFALESLQLIDMFPQTLHLESIAYLVKKSV